MSKVNLILSNSIEEGKKVASNCGLDIEDSAVITNPQFFEHVSLIPDETIYADSFTSIDLIKKFVLKTHELPKGSEINLKIIN